MTSPAMGTTTFLDSVRIMEKTSEFQDSGCYRGDLVIHIAKHIRQIASDGSN